MPLPRAKGASRGRTRSRAKAWRTRGAPIMLPRAEERVAAKTPAFTSPGTRASSRTTNPRESSSPWGRTAERSSPMPT